VISVALSRRLTDMPRSGPPEVDGRRAAVGLPAPGEAAARLRAESGPKPTDLAARQTDMEAAREGGWRE
jgi:hypothetical protein